MMFLLHCSQEKGISSLRKSPSIVYYGCCWLIYLSGADVSISKEGPDDTDLYRHWLKNFVANNLNITHAFYTHPKILVTALNGPAIGLSAALVAFSDFIYCVPHTFLLTPFSSLGLVAEGGASRAFVQRLGISKANEALIMSKRITAEELLQVGFVNKIFDTKKGEDAKFQKLVLEEIESRLGEHLIGDSLLKIKALIRKPEREVMDAQGVAEVFGGLERFVSGVPQEEFRKIATGEKRHKL
jgi:peroxisomal 3,2-trans-enoyl-CoA isomerase